MNGQFEPRYPVFVYGTLLPGQPNAYLWGDGIVAQTAATLLNGRLYDCGGYPMLVEVGETAVRGMVIEVAAAEYGAVLARLDWLEGVDPKRPLAGAYRRVLRGVVTDNGRLQTAWLYLGRKSFVAGLPIIEGGDWVAYIDRLVE